ncbi:glutathione S-transferase [Shimia haliotis]|uniref:Glutathione S-transferase n=1 Tax=Shimia haliotis TaxID=1280847 RepID=A0A1I4CQM0_9RHOB|nr:glutathione S-transferase [Shimia haliotis]SFK82579.1 glutathione S-transferase [Shimia haliotis]
MTYHLLLGDYAYSSWSLRGWLLFEKFDIRRDQTMVDFSDQSVAEQLAQYAPARTVPTMITPEGAVVSDSLAIAEELASRHPDAGFWPTDAKARATARSLAAEMHSGFMALRSDCPMNLRLSYEDASPSKDVIADLARIETIWSHARKTCAAEGPWLCGDYSIADVMFAPVAARIAGYNLPVGNAAAAYVAAHLSDPAFRRWRAMGMVRGATLPWYAKDYTTRPWPGPNARAARAIDEGTPENATCPYSSKPSTHLMEIDGRTFGMCNAFCRDKTVADPEAWPAFMALL